MNIVRLSALLPSNHMHPNVGVERLKRRSALASGVSLAILALAAGPALAQQADPTVQLPTVVVSGTSAPDAYGAKAGYDADTANLGPLGNQSIQNAPQSV